MAVIKSGDDATQLKVDPVSKAARVTLYGVDGNPLSVLLAGAVEITNDVGAPIPVNGTVTVANLQATQPVSGVVAVSNLLATQPVSGTVSVANLPATQTVAGTVAVSTMPAVTDARRADQALSATAAAGSALTLTLPAVANQFHLISSLEITAYSTAARTGSATPVVVSTTNLGGLAWTFASAAAVGTTDVRTREDGVPLRSATLGAATTIVCPATAGVLWRASVTYWTAS